MNKRKYILICTVGIPVLIRGYIIAAILLATRVVERPHFEGPILCTWWTKKNRMYVTTIDAWMGKAEFYDEKIQFHEHDHFWDYIIEAFKAAVVAASVSHELGWWSLAIWGTGGAPWLLVNFITSAIIHKTKGVTWMQALYNFSDHEQDTYAVTKARFDGKKDHWEPES